LDPVVVWIARLGLCGLFLLAAYHKLEDPAAFTRTLRRYDVLPERATGTVAQAVIATELAVALALPWPATTPLSAIVAGLLLATYTAAIVTNLARGRHEIDCGCMGPGNRQPLSGLLVVRNAALLIVAGLAAMPPTLRPLTWIDAMSIVSALVVLASIHHATGLLYTAHHASPFVRRPE
jgi:uncharacterized membrane protein YphA (DoxX/SURF4 family)